jgi:L-ascorbate metabolism protein UlaG (beta-lactamase superfamily)
MTTHHMLGLTVTTVGGPTALLEIGGLRLLTDPTFDAPGDYPMGGGYSLVKTAGPALSSGELGHIDAVLLSHDQHPDNLDTSGRALLNRVATVLTTEAAAARLTAPNVHPMAPWTSTTLPTPNGGALTVTAVPAQHGPDDSHHLLGPVIGFRLDGDSMASIYFSGDNASLAVVAEIRERTGPVDVAVLCVGAAQTPRLGDALLTLSSEQAGEAAGILGASSVVAVHCDGWAHFSEGPDLVRNVFLARPEKLLNAGHGVAVDL